MDLLNNEEILAKPLKKTKTTSAVVMHITENDFLRLLKILEIDFPDVDIVFRDTSPGKLWIMRGDKPK